jgi:hypothetical protein
LFPPDPISITHRYCEWRSGETNATVSSIKDRVETLEESVAADKVEAPSGGSANIIADKVYVACRTADEGVELARPDLCVRSELECRAASCEEERLEVGVLRRGDAEQTSGGVENGASCSGVALERVYTWVCIFFSRTLLLHEHTAKVTYRWREG